MSNFEIDCDAFEFVNEASIDSVQICFAPKEDKAMFGTYCYHQLKNIERSLFIKFCLHRAVMCHFRKAHNIPKKAVFVGFCIECAIDMFVATNYCSKFEDSFPKTLSHYNSSINKMTISDELVKYPDTTHSIKLFLYIVAIPSIFKYICSKQQLFVRFITFMVKSDCYLRDWKQSASDWASCHTKRATVGIGLFQLYLYPYIRQESFVRHKELEKVFNIFYHNGQTFERLEWILMIDGGRFFVVYVMMPFINMTQYQDEIDKIVDPPFEIYYFAIYTSLLVWKYKQKLFFMNAWQNILYSSSTATYEYYGLVLTAFSDKNSKIRKVYKIQLSNYMNEITEFRDRISCCNKKCKINFYLHKYKAPAFSNEMWKNSPKKKWYKCSKCRIVYYCSRKCQKYDWNRFNHKILCNKFNL